MTKNMSINEQLDVLNTTIRQQGVEIEKLRFHMGVIVESMAASSLFAKFIIEYNVTQTELEKLHDVFEQADETLNRGDEVDWENFEKELIKTLPGRNLHISIIVNGMQSNDLWHKVCYGWSRSNVFRS